MRQRWLFRQWFGFGLACFALLLTSACRNGVAKDAAKQETPDQAAAQLSKVVEVLDALAIQFDANKDQSLSPQEQEDLIKYVATKYGPQWADRAKVFLRAADRNGNGTVDRQEWKQAIEKLRRSRSTPAPAKQTFMVVMSDGTHLATDVYLPDGQGPFPVILTRTPYHRTSGMFAASAGRITENGYARVLQDMRGRFDSEGENLPFIACGWGEHQDGAETLAWILKQPWCNGKIGTEGESAMGITQNMLAGAAPAGLTAQYIACAPASMYFHASYVGGALRKCQTENWTRDNKFDPKAIEIILAHPNYDAYWQGIDSTLKFAVMNVPAVHYGGWFDTFEQGTIDSYVGRQHHGAEGAKGRQKLVIGPWHHGGTDRNGMVGDLTFPDRRPPEQYSSARWFDYHLKGIENGIMEQPAVTYYVMGDTSDRKAPGNQWRTAPDWPVPANDTPYYFAPGGYLSAAKPAVAGGPTPATGFVQFIFDPANPCPTIGGRNLTIPRGPKNQNAIECRPDVVLFTTPPLAEPVEVTGRVRAKLFVSSSAADTDLSVRLCDVYPDGKSYLFTDGILRLRYRNSFEKPEPLTPGEMATVTVDCWSTSIIFNRGHRIRVAVTSSNFPRFDVNPGTGQLWSDDAAKVKQTNRIYCDAAHPSCIVLPIVKQAVAATAGKSRRW